MKKSVLEKTKWVIDPAHSEIAFKVKHLMITNVRGVFKEYDASIYTTGHDFMTAEIDVWINPESIDTGDPKRDAHLKSPDFFDVEKYKEISFLGNTYEKKKEKGRYLLYGDLTIKGIKKQVKLVVEFAGAMRDPYGNQKTGFSISGKINRKDWDLNWNTALEGGGWLVGDNIIINCEIQLIRQKAE
jgi:polyisoprenoid-binding protein YceI